MLSIYAYIEIEVHRRTYLESTVCEINACGFTYLVLISLFLRKLLPGKKMTRTALNEYVEYNTRKLMDCGIFTVISTMICTSYN
jgi:hypothetical protein